MPVRVPFVVHSVVEWTFVRGSVVALSLSIAATLLACGSASGNSSDTDGGAPVALIDGGDAGVTERIDAGWDASAPIPLPPSGMTMGATIVDGGVEFRVWAPSSSGAQVSGDFAGGAPTTLTAEDGGLFSATVPGALAGQKYHFTLTTNGKTFQRFDPRARALDKSTGDSIIIDPRTYVWTTENFVRPAPNEAVVYEMYVPAFNAASSTSPGTFVSAIDKLDNLKALGIDLIELMPSVQYGSAEDDWGYDPLAYCAPQLSYGTPDDLRQFVDQAHARGIGVLLDVIYNHYDGGHEGLFCFDGNCPSDNGVYFFSDPTYATTPWGPRPDYSNPTVASFLVDTLFTWLAEYRIDGFRWDSTVNIRSLNGTGTVPGGDAFMAKANDTLHGLFPKTLFVAEDYEGASLITASTSSGGDGFDAQWDGFYGAIDGIVTQPAAQRDVTNVGSGIGFSYNGVGTQRVIFTEDHDIAGNGGARLPTSIDSANPTSMLARKESILAAGVVFMSPGIPMLLQGQELLQTGQWSLNDTPAIDWSDAVTYAPILTFYTDLIALRRNLGSTTAGLLGQHVNVFHVNTSALVLGWQRWDTPGDDVIVLANFSSTAFPSYNLGLPSTGIWHARLNSDSTKYSPDFTNTPAPDVTATATPRDGLPASATLSVGPYSIVVYSQ